MSIFGSDTALGNTGFENSFSEKSIRHGFIRKVYSILVLQLAITLGFICLFLYEPSVKVYTRQHPALFYTALAMTFILMIILACCDSVRRNFPTNMICLFLFTICESFLLGSAASFFNADAVMLAVGICTVVSLGLTIFAFQTKIDFTMCSGFLFVGTLILLCFGFLSIFYYSRILQLVYGCIGAVIFSLYLVFDTQLMMGGNHQYSLSPEEYIFATLNLYVDIINMFMSILQIIGYSRN